MENHNGHSHKYAGQWQQLITNTGCVIQLHEVAVTISGKF